jgi:hypothetical protein
MRRPNLLITLLVVTVLGALNLMSQAGILS